LLKSDFSNVTLVGIISADLSLNVPDLYSSEKPFSSLLRLRESRHRGFERSCCIQTYNPDHFAITSAKPNFESFLTRK
jgi:primosomal protein N' (replication factor Y)